MSIQTSDPVADLITRIRNAIAVGKTEIRVPTSKLKFAVAEKLQKINYIEKAELEKAEPREILHIVINNEGENARINEITKVSKPASTQALRKSLASNLVVVPCSFLRAKAS